MKQAPNQPHRQSAGAQQKFASACRILDEAIAARAFPGCAFGVLVGSDIVLQGARGRFTYEESSPGVEPETVYDVASITKVAATTAATMLLHQRGVLNLETPLGELLPGFVVGRAPEQKARLVTLRHLLDHSSGLPGYVELFRNEATAAELMHACLQVPLEAEPGARVEYSDPGFILLGKALEVCLREDLASWLRRGIYQPLGMTSTGFNPPAAKRSGIPPTEEDTTFRHRCIQGEVQDENAFILKGVAGHAGLFSNVADLLRFAQQVLRTSRNASAQSDISIFESATVELFSQRQGPPGSSRALGWDTPSENSSSGSHFSTHSIGHLGFSGCSMWIDLDTKAAIILLTNRTWPDRQSQLIREVRPAFHDAIRQRM